MKLDIHLNVGQMPVTKKKTPISISPSALADYVHKQKLTHAVVLYTKIEEYRELRDKTSPEVTYFPLKWILDIKNMRIEQEAKGICVHSHRGTLDDQTFGLDYARICKYFKHLRPDSIICVHTQGSVGYTNYSRPMTVGKWACKFPYLKFLVEHAGSYFMTEYYPKIRNYQEATTSKMAMDGLFSLAMGSESLVQEAITVAKRLPNVYLDSSRIHARNYKAYLLSKAKKWAYGSDFPFDHGQFSVDTQARTLSKYYGITEEENKQIHIDGINWLYASTEDLWNNQIKNCLHDIYPNLD